MRSFPSAGGLYFTLRKRLQSRQLTSLLVLAIASVLFVVPNAIAEDDDDLQQRKSQVQRQIKQAEGDLHRSSKKVRQLNNKLAGAQHRLASARSRLTAVRTQLRTAQDRSAQIAQELKRAEQRLARVAAELRQARREVRAQRGEVRGTVTELATDGDPRLEALTSMMDSGSLEELMINRTAAELVVNTQFRSLEDLEAAEVAMAERKREVKTARNQVAVKKQQAEQQVRRTRTLVSRAATVTKSVRTLVAATAKARRQAQQARAQDRNALRRLEARERTIRRKILAASRNGPDHSGKAGGFLQRPVDGPITSPYGYRTHPIYGYYSLHNGVDFGAPCGSPLHAGSDGRVVHAYYDEVYGYRLYLAIGRVNGDRITLVYNHMPGLIAGSGRTFARGDVVGYVGSTGWSTGCHLHFTVLRNGNPVDPMTYL